MKMGDSYAIDNGNLTITPRVNSNIGLFNQMINNDSYLKSNLNLNNRFDKQTIFSLDLKQISDPKTKAFFTILRQNWATYSKRYSSEGEPASGTLSRYELSDAINDFQPILKKMLADGKMPDHLFNAKKANPGDIPDWTEVGGKH